MAFEVARILGSHGCDVKGIVLIDAPCSLPAPPLLSDALIQHILRDTGQERAVDTLTTTLVMCQFKQSAMLLNTYVPSALRADVPLAFLRCTAAFCPEGIEDVPAWFRDREHAASTVGPWRELVGRDVPAWDVPGHHFEPFSRLHVSRLWATLVAFALIGVCGAGADANVGQGDIGAARSRVPILGDAPPCGVRATPRVRVPFVVACLMNFSPLLSAL